MLTSRTCMFRTVHTLPVVSHPFDENSLLDPSCSGSGIINRLDHLMETGTFCRLLCLRTGGSLTSLISPPRHRQEAEGSSVAQAERLVKLATFQLQMLRHAMKCMFNFFFF
jgi:16S rRNA C967 or C1407 C5-methylase (RsmB/RsmF family)